MKLPDKLEERVQNRIESLLLTDVPHPLLETQPQDCTYLLLKAYPIRSFWI